MQQRRNALVGRLQRANLTACLPLFRLRRHLLVLRGRLLFLVFGLIGGGVVGRRGRLGPVFGLVGLVRRRRVLLLRRGLVVVVLLHLAEGRFGVRADAARQEHRLLRQVLLALLGHVVAGLDEPLDVTERTR